MEDKKAAVLLLEDGTMFQGVSIGKVGTTTGEIAFNTGMTGYQEVFTDPSYYGQVLVMNTAHIGNYGTHELEVESDGMKIAGLVVKKFSDGYSRPSANMSLNDYMIENNKVGISDIDTRALVRHIRSKGAMNAIISSDNLDVESLRNHLKSVPSMDGLELSSKVATSEAYEVKPENVDFKVSLISPGPLENPVALNVPAADWRSVDIALTGLTQTFSLDFGNTTVVAAPSSENSMISFPRKSRSLFPGPAYSPAATTTNPV